ncbi:6627_t:CDS:10 [Paraglomus occultum]|uniref:6627_t:CDS:1 n=1 Tax=Paraglomus occultum TaxID=144539 RepID=A0A9N9GBE6_9GLOM|nr:6627_t:CDS:10 [Paraglomus occultum]
MTDTRNLLRRAPPPPTELPPLITWIDPPTQRYYAFCVLVGLWSIKLGRLLISPRPTPLGIWWWYLLDITFVIIYIPLGYLNGQHLDPSQAYCRRRLRFVITSGYQRFFGERVHAISSQGIIKIDEVRHNSSHIKGKHIVRFLPYATAKLNPDDDKFCLQRVPRVEVDVPVLFNNSKPWKLEYSHIDPDTNEKTHINMTRKLLQKRLTSDEIANTYLVYIPIDHPGVYRLEQAWDKDNMNIKTYRNEVIISHCPIAKFVARHSSDRCIDDDINVDLILQGVPPFNVRYERLVDDVGINMTISGVAPDRYVSPIMGEQVVSHDYTWARNRVVEVPLNLTADTAATYILKLIDIQDGLNNTRTFSGKSLQDDTVMFLVHPRPYAKLLSDSTVKVRPGKSTNLSLELGGEGPWSITTGYWAEDVAKDGDSSAPNKVETIKFLPNKDTSIIVSKPGMYQLLSISDTFCSGQVLVPSSCIVIEVQPPSVKIEAVPIPAIDCPGEIGQEITVSLTGTPPWSLHYSITTKLSEITDFKKIFKSRHTFTIMPKTFGRHEYRFFLLRDGFYDEGVNIDHRITQVVHPKPDATFRTTYGKELNTCVGNNVELDVDFSGSGPFTLEYEVVFNRRKNTFTVGDIKSLSHVISSPPFDNPGTYTVTLVRVTDAKGCSNSLNASDDITIHVKKDRPTVGFRTDGEAMKFIEGDRIDLPLQLTGHPPWDIEYGSLNVSSKARMTARNLKDPNAHVTVTLPGLYELLSVKDSFCTGEVIESMRFIRAEWLPQPTLRIADGEATLLDVPNYYERKPVCEGTEDSVGVILSGRAPWIISYKITGEGEPIPQRETIGFPSTRIRLLTESPGTHTYEFKTIADDVYTLPNEISLTLRQIIISNPTAHFIQHKTFNQCVGETLPFSQSPKIQLKGIPPFSLTVETKNENSNRIDTQVIHNIADEVYTYVPPKFMAIGNYSIAIVKVIDAQGCSRKQNSQESKLRVEVNDVASIQRLIPQDIHCVGDLLVYQLQGTPPWVIHYTYNGEKKNVVSNTPDYTFGADRPGNVTITSVCHLNEQCCGHPKGMSEVIYDLPTAIISSGKETISDIREGEKDEIVIEFIGNPPFRFTYTRSEILPKGKPGRVLETQTVTNVRGHKHSLFVSQEGIFQVIYIADKYCDYPREGTTVNV